MNNDTISRQAAICAIEEYADRLQMVNWEKNPGVPYKVHTLNWAINTLRDLPSAEQQEVQSSECKYWDDESNFCALYRPSAESNLPFEIQDILDYLDTVLHPIVSPEHWNVYAELYDMISMLPSAQSERKMGHWIEITSSNHTYKCSVCGRLLVNITDGKNNVAKNYPYCHCGADMRGEENE